MTASAPLATEGLLLRRYRERGDRTAREQLVEIMTPLVDAVARRYRGCAEPEDLRQAASLGLAKAIERFDPRFGVPLRVYAIPTMNGEVLRHLRNASWAVRPPRSVQERALAVLQASDELTRRRGRAPTADDLAAELDLPVEEVLEALQAADAHHSISLDGPREAHHGDTGTLADAVGHDDPRLARAEQIADLRRLRGRLTEIARDTMHQQQWLAVLEELEDPANAPGDFENEGEFAQVAYGFFNHADVEPPPDARWVSGPSLDGKGTFHVVDPRSTAAPRPELQDAPHDMHRGPEATMATTADGDGDAPGLLSQLREAFKA